MHTMGKHKIKLRRKIHAVPFIFFVLTVMAASHPIHAQSGSTASVPEAPAASSAISDENFIERWKTFYTNDWSGKPNASEPAPQKRGIPAPLDSPPFPNSDWS